MAKLGTTLYHFHSLPSTNDLAREMATLGTAEGVGVLAYRQTAGRGRHGRSWSSPSGEGLYLSVILRPELKPSLSGLITLGAAVAVAETLISDFGVSCDIKWPNDVLANRRKICGILVESASESGRLHYAVLGIGINLTQSSFDGDLRETATSVFIETGKKIGPLEVVPPLTSRLESYYRAVSDRPETVVEKWQEFSSSARDCRVRIKSGDRVIVGTTRGLTPTGALVLELDDGERLEFVSGEVSLRI
jgi:BirA family biotin operon repressor/biotin-[acetyl-CoA-carboxylase] ligase